MAVSDVLNPNLDDMSRGVGPLGYGSTQGDFSPQVSHNLCTFTVLRSYLGFRKKNQVLEELRQLNSF